jgi:hypothetical protein
MFIHKLTLFDGQCLENDSLYEDKRGIESSLQKLRNLLSSNASAYLTRLARDIYFYYIL